MEQRFALKGFLCVAIITLEARVLLLMLLVSTLVEELLAGTWVIIFFFLEKIKKA